MALRKKKEDVPNDPFLDMAKALSGDDDNTGWDEEPVDIEEFINSEKFMNLKFNPETGRGCRPKIMEIAKELVNPNVREAILLLGKGCLAGDTVIWTKDGSRTMEELSGEMVRVQSYSETTGYSFWNNGMCLPRGIQKVKKYTFRTGNHLVATSNHKFRVATKGVIQAKDLEVGDQIAYPKGLMSVADGNKYYDKSWTNLVSIEEAGEEETYDIICRHNDAPLEAFLLRSFVLKINDPIKALESILPLKEKYWDDLQYLQVLLDLSYKSGKEEYGHKAFMKLRELQHEGKVPAEDRKSVV